MPIVVRIVRGLDRVAVYGRIGGVAIYELLGVTECVGFVTPEWVRSYETGFAACENRRWSEAINLFEATAAIRRVVDRTSELLIER